MLAVKRAKAREGARNAHAPTLTPLRSTREVATYLATSVPNLYRLLRSGRLCGRKVGGQWRVSDDAVREYLEDQIYVPKKRN